MTEDATSDENESPPTPRWVKLFLVVFVLLVLLVSVLILTGVGGEHGPGRHALGMLPGCAPLAVCRGSGPLDQNEHTQDRDNDVSEASPSGTGR